MLIMSMLIIGCQQLRQIRLQYRTLPTVELPHRIIDEIILNPKPDYGISGMDGCTPFPIDEIGLLLDSVIVVDSIAHIYGVAVGRQKTPLARLNVSYSSFVGSVTHQTDTKGRFHLQAKYMARKLCLLYIRANGHRQLLINLNQLVRLAAEDG